MEPKTLWDEFRIKHPYAEWSCKRITYNVDYFVPNLTGIYRKTPIECTIDNQRRDCEGKCSLYKKSWLHSILNR